MSSAKIFIYRPHNQFTNQITLLCDGNDHCKYRINVAKPVCGNQMKPATLRFKCLYHLLKLHSQLDKISFPKLWGKTAKEPTTYLTLDETPKIVKTFSSNLASLKLIRELVPEKGKFSEGSIPSFVELSSTLHYLSSLCALNPFCSFTKRIPPSSVLIYMY